MNAIKLVWVCLLFVLAAVFFVVAAPVLVPMAFVANSRQRRELNRALRGGYYDHP